MGKEMKITEKELLRINRSASRDAEIEFGLRIPTHKVHKSKKSYNRKDKHRGKTNY